MRCCRACARIAYRSQRHASTSASKHTSFDAPEIPIEALSGSAQERHRHFEARVPRAITLKELARFGRPPLSEERLIALGEYTRAELPHRLARRVKAHQTLPYIVGSNPSIARIFELYQSSFELLTSFPRISSYEDFEKFTSALNDTVELHSSNIPVLAQGFQECKRYMSDVEISQFLDRAIRNRISIRLIAEQHLSLAWFSRKSKKPRPARDRDQQLLGLIDLKCSPAGLVKGCESFVSDLCEASYGVAPSLVLDGQIDATCVYVPMHLEYIFTELLKNAFRATAERHRASSRPLPPVIVTVASAPALDLMTIRFRDEGGGLSPENERQAFSYSFTSVVKDQNAEEEAGPYSTQPIGAIASSGSTDQHAHPLGTLAGLGFGLPLSRLYCNYFGGSLELKSMYGHGTDVYVTLKSSWPRS
ncbi:hypothetical protein E5Q_02664 [Mixia osmundae IAM 14324]|uniref:Protein-serine/threonine kinase n=1 Tax=Mixia osmundae (strain CBS 9802 / IAM 14324 / JCM 22182 / KY 12970) TaxID=764103 RepID=G7DZJ4_MIXOS|nr:hypothetical protein E5Q_02664 [Mixia osmundae IAM 14324]